MPILDLSNPTSTADGKSIVSMQNDVLDVIVNKYKAILQYKDDFSNGTLNGWREQYDSSSPGRTGITLTDEARMGAYSLLLHTRPTNLDECWMRKGLQVPPGVKKVIKGCFFMVHGVNTNTPRHFQFDFDYQTGDGTNNVQSGSPSGNGRKYYSVRYLNYDTALRTKLQVNTGTPTSQSFTDVPNGTVLMAWNEAEKPLLNYIAMVFNIETGIYEGIFMNGLEFNLKSAGLGPQAGASLLNYDGGAIDINLIANRSDTTSEAQMQVERPILAYVMGS